MGLSLIVYGTPAPQGSKRHVGRGVMVESSKKVKPWRDDVRAAALAVVGCACLEPECTALAAGYPLDGPLVVAMVFTFRRPRSHFRTGRNAHLLRDGAPARPAGVPDLSKLLRSTEDALTGLAWVDDARVVEYERAAKVYAGEDPDALMAAPGVRITIRTAPQEGLPL